jgi:hypothetical protein
MLRAAGLTAYAMRVVDRSRGIFTPEYLDYGQLDDTIVILSLDGKEIFLDPGQKMCPFRTMSWKHSAATGLRRTANGTAIATSPLQAFAANAVQWVADLTVDSHGAVQGAIRFGMAGQEALYWRQQALVNDQDEVKRQFDSWIATMVPDGVEAHIDQFLSLDEYELNLVGVVHAGGSLGTVTGKHLFLPGLFFASRPEHPFVAQDKRVTPIDIHYPRIEREQEVYHLPAGFQVESGPLAAGTTWPGHAVLKIDSKTSAGRVEVTRALAYNFTILNPGEYSSLHDFFQKVASADQQQLVLTPTLPVKGN